jgi:hypothetical protein
MNTCIILNYLNITTNLLRKLSRKKKKRSLPQNPALSPLPIANMYKEHMKEDLMEGRQKEAKQKWQI